MASDRNVGTKEAVTNEIKALQERCIEAINIIENSPFEMSTSPEITLEKALNYVEGLRTEVQNSNTPITMDENLITVEFMNEIKQKTDQVRELNAFLKGSISDIDSEIERLKNQIEIAEAAKKQTNPQRAQIQPVHIQAAKEKFQMFKTELHGLISSIFPDRADSVKETMAELMTAKMKEESNGYIPVTDENYAVIQLLKEKNVVSVNPYNHLEVRLAM